MRKFFASLMKSIKSQGFVVGLFLMLLVAVFNNELFYKFLSFFTSLKVKFARPTLTHEEEMEVKKAVSDATSGTGFSGEVTKPGTYHDEIQKLKDMWSEGIEKSYTLKFQNKIANTFYGWTNWRLWETGLIQALFGYFNYVGDQMGTPEKKEYFKNLSSADKLKIACDLAFDTDSVMMKLFYEVVSDLRNCKGSDVAFEGVKYKDSPVFKYQSQVKKNNLSGLMEYFKEAVKNSFLEINNLYMNKGITLF